MPTTTRARSQQRWRAHRRELTGLDQRPSVPEVRLHGCALVRYDGAEPCAYARRSASVGSPVAGYLGRGQVAVAVARRGSWLRIAPHAAGGAALTLLPEYEHIGLPAVWLLAYDLKHGRLLHDVDAGSPMVDWPLLVSSLSRAQGHEQLYMPIDPLFPGLRQVHLRPPVYEIDGFLNAAECRQLMASARPLLHRSQAKGRGQTTPRRTSFSCALAQADAAAAPVVERVAKLTGVAAAFQELPQVARYTSSQRYSEHHDGADPSTASGREFLEDGGQRICTVLIYLNDVAEGGGTHFPLLELTARPKQGRALVFFPGFANGELDTDMVHCAQPAVDTKWVSQVWLRQDVAPACLPTKPAPLLERGLLQGPLHEGIYMGPCVAGEDAGPPAMMTYRDALKRCRELSEECCQGFCYQHESRKPDVPVRVWFKRRLLVLDQSLEREELELDGKASDAHVPTADDATTWWTYSRGWP